MGGNYQYTVDHRKPLEAKALPVNG